MKISINIIATGKYEIYIDPLIESIEKFFMTGHDIKIILYTDSIKFAENLRNNLHVIQIENEPWPNPTLKRFHYFLLGEKIIENSDFTFYIDVDSLFINKVDLHPGEMHGIIPTLHPGFYGKVGTPERNPRSKAYLPVDSDNLYFCGGFFGGNSKFFIKSYYFMFEARSFFIYSVVIFPTTYFFIHDSGSSYYKLFPSLI